MELYNNLLGSDAVVLFLLQKAQMSSGFGLLKNVKTN